MGSEKWRTAATSSSTPSRLLAHEGEEEGMGEGRAGELLLTRPLAHASQSVVSTGQPASQPARNGQATRGSTRRRLSLGQHASQQGRRQAAARRYHSQTLPERPGLAVRGAKEPHQWAPRPPSGGQRPVAWSASRWRRTRSGPRPSPGRRGALLSTCSRWRCAAASCT
jgi:hypothetical protein